METQAKKLPATDTVNENCFWQLDLYSGKLYWSDELCQLLGFIKPYTPSFEQLIRYFQPEKNLRAAFNHAIHQGISFELELPATTASDKLILVATTAAAIYDDYGKCVAIKGVLQTAQEQSAVKPTAFISDTIEEHHIMFENFSRIVSHNLRSHTSNLQMILASINQKTSSKEIREMIGNIKTISSNLNQTVGYLNTLVKI